MQVLVEGICAPGRLLALVRDFIVFEDDGSGALAKKMAGYHQFHAVETAVAETLRENIRANLRRLVKRILRKHGYPPDKQEKATRTVIEQAEVLSAG